MQILFITSTYLGDSILSTGALDHLAREYPGADITVACGPVAADIFRAFPGVKIVIVMKKQPYAGHWRRLLRETFGTKWDLVVDLRNSAVSRLLRSQRKLIFQTRDPALHKVAQIGALLGAHPPPAPILHFDDATRAAAAAIAPDGPPILALGPTANWPGKEWGAENFVALAQRITGVEGFMPGARVAVIAAPGEEARAAEVLNSIPPDRRVDAIAKGSPLLGAAVLARCSFYVGNDSGLMHAAAATRIPTLGLFGYGWPALYGPWGDRGVAVTTAETPDQLIAPYGGDPAIVKTSLLTSLTVDAVYDAAAALWGRQA
ncbi:MAG TPA: glycosyltransferase family 9 protein [Patescibacteria group bacterium]|nr:glycosyltransferase family 9 protein [Patescibacteria group bacterium]